MNAEQLKSEIRKILGEGIVFNKEFDDYSTLIKNIDSILLPWCKSVAAGELSPSPSPYEKGKLVFIKKIGSSTRCVIIKVVNGEFTEVHLADHKYYDLFRKHLGLKKGSHRW
ncbi:hypothetical protein HYU19_04440 [Candidatus Woesearchaeota archaeon]|nr:hypothetical protein [Candidatus Woesearchaeota archaeon]